MVSRELTAWLEARLTDLSRDLGVAVRTANRENASGELDRPEATSLLARTVVELAHLDDCVADLPVITEAARAIAERHATDLETAFRTLADASQGSNQTLGAVARQSLAGLRVPAPGRSTHLDATEPGDDPGSPPV